METAVLRVVEALVLRVEVPVLRVVDALVLRVVEADWLREGLVVVNVFHVGMLLEQRHKATAELAAADKTHTDFSSHANSLFKYLMQTQSSTVPFISAAI